MSSTYALQRLRTRNRRQIPEPIQEEAQQEFVNISQLMANMKRRLRPISLINNQQYTISPTVTPVIIVQD